ncbi:hypothetical protein [Paenibacillus lautus]|uniref:hypothetical protein n=1 Tax=Paenibacillus lautus TaxID=1401 RepID=UPI001C7CB552|nr:hypothetical protein [Paenibacillus lautus]MBX4152389.1 hypothetical protein [Paenibacillus lautus]
MNLTAMKQEYESAKTDYKNVTTRTAKRGISEELNSLKKKIDDEERRLNAELKIESINGVDYEIPNGFGYYREGDRYTYEVKDGCLYRFERMKLDSDGSFHLHHHVWIPQTENKYVDLCVRILGGDRFGERYFLSASYYKHPSDSFPYMHKDIRTDNYGYKPYYTYVIEKMGFKHKKDRHETNKLEWKVLEVQNV